MSRESINKVASPTFAGDLSRAEVKYDLHAHLIMSFIWPRMGDGPARLREYRAPVEDSSALWPYVIYPDNSYALRESQRMEIPKL